MKMPKFHVMDYPDVTLLLSSVDRDDTVAVVTSYDTNLDVYRSTVHLYDEIVKEYKIPNDEDVDLYVVHAYVVGVVMAAAALTDFAE